MSLLALVALGLALLGLYAFAMSRVADRLQPPRQAWRTASFVAGLAVTLLAFRPSPDLLGAENRFATNMGQLLLMFEVAPPLVLWGVQVVVPAPSSRWDALGRRLTGPLLAGVISSATLVLWHLPAIFVLASGSLAIWTLKQGLLLAAGLLAWLPVEGPVPAWRAAPALQLLYLFVWRTPMMLVGAVITFAEVILYPSRSVGLEICAPASLADQQMAGVVMLTVSGLLVLVVFTVVFFRRVARA